MRQTLRGGAAPQYRVDAPLGKGGMAMVHVATMTTPAGERRVAIKQLLDRDAMDSEAAARVVAEARLVFQLTHANICQVLDLGSGDDGAFIVMEYVNGVDLAALLSGLERRGATMPIAAAVYIARELAHALDFAHRFTDTSGTPLRLVHGDVTPRNTLLSVEGEVKLCDFGIARSLGALGTAHAPGNELYGGTPGFMSPEAEQRGALDHRSDIFSLGRTLAAAIKGQSLPGDLRAIVERATAVRPEDRYLSAQELEGALSFYLARHHPDFTRSVLAELVRAQPRAKPAAVNPSAPRRLVSMTREGTFTTYAEPMTRPRPGTLPVSERARGRWIGASIGLVLLATVGVVATRSRVRQVSAPIAASMPPPAPASAPAQSSAPPPSPTPAPAQPTVRAPTAAAPPAHAARPQARARGAAFLTVNSFPWGAVYVDGKRMAEETPAYRLRVASGRRQVTIYNPERKAFSAPHWVNLEPGKSEVLSIRW